MSCGNIQISAIAAMSDNDVIGINNQLPWRMPADLKHFKTVTMGYPILMGRKTYESIGRPLPGRLNLVMTRDPHYAVPGVVVVRSFDEAVSEAGKVNASALFIIGGAAIYEQLLPLVTRLYLTKVHHAFAGDAYFPTLNQAEWQTVSNEKHVADALNPYDYSFMVLEKRKGAT